MKQFWIISTLAVLAAMIFGSLLHRRGQEVPDVNAESGANARSSFVAESQFAVEETAMPFDFPLMPELLPEPKGKLPQVRFVSESLSGGGDDSPGANEPVLKRVSTTSVKKHISTVDLSKNEIPEVAPVAIEKKVEPIAAVSALNEGRFLPIVLHIESEDGKLILQGSIPTRENTDAVYAAAVKVVGEDSVDNYLKYSPDTLDADWVAYLSEYIETFFSHSAGGQALTVVDGILKLRGDVASENSMNGLVALADSLKEGGLAIESGLVVKKSLAGELPELPGTYAAIVDATPEFESEEGLELAMLDEAGQLRIGENTQSRSDSISAEDLKRESEPTATAEPEVFAEAESGPVEESASEIQVAEASPIGEAAPDPEFHGPAVSPEEWTAGVKKAKVDLAAAKAKAEAVAAAKAKAKDDAANLAAAEQAKAEKEAADAAAKELKLAVMLASGERIPDDGKPLIFYFETDSTEIISSDREKLLRAKQRVQIPRSIVYLTAYADYRGGYELNRKLSLERAGKVKALIFEGDVADEVTAEITAKGDSKSSKAKTGEALKRSRRVVVEVYHLKR